MATWELQGEAAKSFDATVRNINTLDVTSARFSFRSLGVDVFTYTLEVDSDTPAGDIPELTQTITLFRNGARFFHGNVTDLKERTSAASSSITVTVSGPMWYAENIPLTATNTDGIGVAADRTLYGFVSQNLKTTIEAVINRGTALGVPWQLGTVSNFFAIPQTTINQMSVAEALAEVVRMVPDAMQWIDYSTSPPTVNVTRRGVAATRTIAATDTTGYEVNPVLQLGVTQVVVPYVERAVNGRRSYKQQSAGSPTVAQIGITTISGPELDTFLPDDAYDSFQLQTIPTNAGGGNFLVNYLNTHDPVLTQLIEKYGPLWFGANQVGLYLSRLVGSDGESLPYHASAPSGSSIPSQQATVGASFIVNGAPLSGTKYLVLGETTIPDWVTSDNGMTVYNAMLNMDVYVELKWKQSVQPTQPTIPGIVEFAGFTWLNLQNEYSEFGDFYNRISYFIYKADIAVKLIDTSYPVQTTLYRRQTYAFTAPPANFASNLLAAQSFTPYEGQIEMRDDDVGGTRYRGCIVNMTGTRIAAHATMGAMVSAEDLDLFNNATSITLGTPPRINYRQFMDKVSQVPAAQITFLT